MSRDKSILSLVVLLIVVIALFGIVCSFSSVKDNDAQAKTTSGSSQVLIEIMGERAVPDVRPVVSDQYVNEYDHNGKVVVLSSDGSAYAVVSGRVIASDVLVDVDENEHVTYRINDPEKSSSSNYDGTYMN